MAIRSLNDASDLVPSSALLDGAIKVLAAMTDRVATIRPGLDSAVSRPLRGRNIGILCADLQRPEAASLQRAAGELGARATILPADIERGGGGAAPEHIASVLGRLYDALICIEVPADVVALLQSSSGVPVHADLLARWTALSAGRVEDARLVLQAMLCG